MKPKILDTIGISAATLCLLHCIVFPLLMVLPFGITHSGLIDLLFLVIGILIVYSLSKRTSNQLLLFLFWLSLAFISVSVFADLFFEIHLPFIYIGAVGLIIGHIINFKNHKHSRDN